MTLNIVQKCRICGTTRALDRVRAGLCWVCRHLRHRAWQVDAADLQAIGATINKDYSDIKD